MRAAEIVRIAHALFMLAALMSAPAFAQNSAVAQAGAAALAPTGPLRAGLVEAPNASTLFVVRQPDGSAKGPAADLVADLARTAGRPLAVTIFPNTGAATAALQAGGVDVAFMPVDETRKQLIDFGPGYFPIESTYLVSGASGVTDVAGVDRPGMRVIAIDGTTTFRASARTLKQTQPKAVPSVAEAIAMMRDGKADAFALSRDTLAPVVAQAPGSRIADGWFQQTLVAVAVPKGRPAALAFVTAWLDHAKTSGLVRRVFDANGFKTEAVAP